ncbi:S41 family peptidase [Polaribacter sargassicola]|uniref:S41 family peptidase n=1 Tax=Polaribacter sargassicola TaxID=2836891 RepID=UPI001F015FE4|nr:S41 family peptidase [Polaribacter sp. DS7-9]MCG1036868.1 peptidase S41 [Polaribacter sp. DS7-9]
MSLKFSVKTVIVLFVSVLFFNCSTKSEDIPVDIEVQDFVWKGLNAYYLWQSSVPDLSDTRFSSQTELNSYLEGYTTPEALFSDLIYTPTDRFSWIVDDYVELENSFQGISLNNGMEFGLRYYSDGSTNVYGYVRYVIPGSDAEANGVTRGMIFNQIDGTQITDTNYTTLLSSTTYTIGLANYNAGSPIASGASVTLTKTDLTENPILVTNVFDEGTTKIGYIMYNQFSSSFDSELNTAFSNFKAEGITDLIVDLRYNGGGSVNTATYLGSMITGQFNNEVFSKQVWNEKAMAVFEDEDLTNYFTDQISNTDSYGDVVLEETINSLNLSTIYFIVSGSSASASELVINSLSSYIDVRVIGTTTVGKQVGSITLYDSDNLTRTGTNLSTNHTYAIQPIVLEITNKDDINYPDGIIPATTFPGIYLAEEDSNLGILGEKSEPLLNRTITYITTGAKGVSSSKNNQELKELFNSKMLKPNYNNMYVDFN